MRLIPRDEVFFSMFASLASRVTASARLLDQLFAEPHRLAELVTSIKQIEHEADTITHDVISRINRTFVTPIDREDIHLLASRLDDVIDQIDGTARRALMFRINEVREPATRMTRILIRAGEAIEGAVTNVKKTSVVVQHSVKVKQLEEEGDAVYHAAVGGLFEGTPDPLQVMKWKELYDTLERALDQCEDVANTIESIALKNG
jgi:predicted phosphate transport protein (TIGR00153 family)